MVGSKIVKVYEKGGGVLSAVEQGMKNHSLVPLELVAFHGYVSLGRPHKHTHINTQDYVTEE